MWYVSFLFCLPSFLLFLFFLTEVLFLIVNWFFNRGIFCFLKAPSLSIIYVLLTLAYQRGIHALGTGNKFPLDQDIFVLALVLDMIVVLLNTPNITQVPALVSCNPNMDIISCSNFIDPHGLLYGIWKLRKSVLSSFLLCCFLGGIKKIKNKKKRNKAKKQRVL